MKSYERTIRIGSFAFANLHWQNLDCKFCIKKHLRIQFELLHMPAMLSLADCEERVKTNFLRLTGRPLNHPMPYITLALGVLYFLTSFRWS